MASKNAMTIKGCINLVKDLPPWVTVLLRANHGVGKSQIIRQIANHTRNTEFGGKGYPLIDRRLGQVTEGDIIGLPSTEGRVTRFNPPDWVKQACDEPVALFLDEINRATTEVLQAAFQLVLDRELSGWKLHPQTRVYAAINCGATYTVTQMDPALLDRFAVVDLTPSVDEWLDWAKGDGKILYSITSWIEQNSRFLDPPHDAEVDAVHTSRRSMERTSLALTHLGIQESPEDPRFYQTAMLFLGTEAAISLTDFAKSIDSQLSGADILDMVKKIGPAITKKNAAGKVDYDVVSIGCTPEGATPENKKVADDTTYNKKVIDKINWFGPARHNELLEKVVEEVKARVAAGTFTPKNGVAFSKFASILTGENRIAFWGKLTSGGITNADMNRTAHKWISPHVLDVFGVPMGAAGVGKVPNIPDIFNKK